AGGMIRAVRLPPTPTLPRPRGRESLGRLFPFPACGGRPGWGRGAAAGGMIRAVRLPPTPPLPRTQGRGTGGSVATLLRCRRIRAGKCVAAPAEDLGRFLRHGRGMHAFGDMRQVEAPQFDAAERRAV